MITAFSRAGPKKVYVQHRLKERAKEVNELLEQKAYFYVCGDAANMAREVNTILAQILSEERGISEAKAEEIVKNMRAANFYQVRCLPLFCRRFVLFCFADKDFAGGRLVLTNETQQRSPNVCLYSTLLHSPYSVALCLQAWEMWPGDTGVAAMRICLSTTLPSLAVRFPVGSSCP